MLDGSEIEARIGPVYHSVSRASSVHLESLVLKPLHLHRGRRRLCVTVTPHVVSSVTVTT